MPKFQDLTGQKFNMLTVIEIAEKGNGKTKWKCRCDCGNEVIVASSNLKNGHTKSCGCNKHKSAANYIDLTGKRFGRLTVLGKGNNRKTSGGNIIATWICKCDCGNNVIVDSQPLRNGKTRSCGCLIKENNRTIDDITGLRFGRLVVIRKLKSYEKKSRQYCWLCKCDCGNYTHGCANKLKEGLQKSCGCLKEEIKTDIGNVNRKYKFSDKRLYGVFKSMHSRCRDKNHREYHNYGGRGIKVCEEWNETNGYDAFAEWAIKNGYDSNADFGECTLDRIDTNKDYSPDNCRWITNKEQQANRRDSIILEYSGEKHCIAEWSRLLNVSEDKIRYHVRKGRDLYYVMSH